MANKFEDMFETTSIDNSITIKNSSLFYDEVELDSSNNFVEYPALSLKLSDTDITTNSIDKDSTGFGLYSVKIEIIKDEETVASTYCYVEGE